MLKLLCISCIIALAVGFLACGGGADTDGVATRTEATASVSLVDDGVDSAGHGYPTYPEPVQVVPGNYVSPAGLADAQEEGFAALDQENAKPRFDGVVNGFRLYSYEARAADSSIERDWCGGGEIIDFHDWNGFSFGYLPPGTAATSPQFASICEDGKIANAGQQFVTYNATFDIVYVPGERAFPHDASEDRVSPVTINDRPGVLISPITEKGFGRSWVAYSVDEGFILVDAQDLPLEEVLKISEGISCATC